MDFMAKRRIYLIKELTKSVYPTTQIISGDITVEKYITSIADFLANEIIDRRMPVETLSLFAELGILQTRQNKNIGILPPFPPAPLPFLPKRT